MLCNSSSSLLYTDLEKITGTLMASHVLRPYHVDSVPAPTAHRPSYYTTIRTNHSTPSRPVALKTLIWCRSSRGKIGLPDWTMICHNRRQSPRTPLTVASSQQFVSRRQRYLVAQKKFTEHPLTTTGPQSRLGTALLVLPRFIVWWSPGKDADLGEAV